MLFGKVFWSEGFREQFPHSRSFEWSVRLGEDDLSASSKLNQNLSAVATGVDIVFSEWKNEL